jgi:predicted porin
MAQSTVEIYGRANLGIDSWKADGSTLGDTTDFKRRTRIFDGSSRLGFRVNESLGGGMRAFVVMETGVNIDTGNNLGQSGAANGSSGFWASRDSYVGIGGGWGDVRFGRQSIWWGNGVIAQVGSNYINTGADSLINDPGVMAVPVTRQSNVISYNSPTIGGFNASLSYSPTSEAAGAGAETDGKVYGITGRFTTGPIRAQADWATNKGATPATGERTELSAWKVGAGFAYAPNSQISAIFGRYSNENILAGVATDFEAKQNFWLLNWEHMLGQLQLIGQVYRTGKIKADGDEADDTSTTGYTAAAKYFLSKRTGVYVSYNVAKNQDLQFADFSGGGISSGGAAGIPASAAGADVKIMAIGIMHNF